MKAVVFGCWLFGGRTDAFGLSFPWGYIHTNPPGKEVISATEAREDYYLAIGGTNLLGVTSMWEKDALGIPARFGYSETNAYVDRSFSTNLDLTAKDYGVVLAMFADDKAEISIYEFGSNGQPGGTPVHTFWVAGGAAWRPASYKEDDFIRLPGKKYKLDLAYRNERHWNDNRVPGKEDVDGVSVYRMVLKVDLTEAKGLYTSNGTYQVGYTSTDNVGRVYCNSAYDPANPSSNSWSKNKQFVDFTVQVIPTNAVLPSGARIVWEAEDRVLSATVHAPEWGDLIA